MVQSLYRLVVKGQLGAAAREAFARLDIATQKDRTALTGRMDQAALLDNLRRVGSLDLVLVTVERLDDRRA